MTIWKFELEKEDIQSIQMPVGAEILCLQMQGGKPCIWALVNPQADNETRGFITYGTGHVVPTEPYNHIYIGTYQLFSGDLVFHVFEFKVPPTPNQKTIN